MDREKLKDKLSNDEFDITQNKGTEAPFSGKYLDNKKWVSIDVSAVMLNFSPQNISMILDLDGQASMMLFLKIIFH